MEKFRAFLEVLKKYHFWVLCGLIVLLDFAGWFFAISSEEKDFTARKSKIESSFSTVRAISNNAEHPSRAYVDQVAAITNGPLAAQVKKASSRLYDEQHAANPLPLVFPNSASDQASFQTAFEKIWRQPIEEIEKLPPGTLDQVYREKYRDHIAEHFPKLFQLIEQRTEVEDGGSPVMGGLGRGGRGGFGGGPGGKAKQTTGIVDWTDAEQKKNTFLDRFTRSVPTTLDIMMAQEELWVYETLLKVVRNTNNVGANKDHYVKPASHKQARIKQILAMDIGKDAVQEWTASEKPVFDLATDTSHAPAENRGPQPMPQSGRPGTMVVGQNPGASPLVNRYVDDKGKPLADPTQQPFGEFRMMPVTLKVVIEQREIPRLLAECANSAMRIDVRGVRILEEHPAAVALTAAAAPTDTAAPNAVQSGAGGQGRPAMPEHGGAIPMNMGRGGDTSGRNDFTYNEESADPVYPPVPVEVHGIIYIYNPPKMEDGGGDAGGTAGQVPSAGTPGTTAPGPSGATPAAGASPSNAAVGTGSATLAPANGVPANSATAPAPTVPAPTVPAPTVPATPSAINPKPATSAAPRGRP